MKKATIIIALMAAPLYGDYVLKKVRTVGGDYAPAQLQIAINDAANYQTTVACVPYIIEWEAGTVYTSPVTLPKKEPQACKEYVWIRSSRIAEMPEGVRVTPQDAPKMARIEPNISANPLSTVPNWDGLHATGYWRFSGIEMKPGNGQAPYFGAQLGITWDGATGKREDMLDKTPEHITLDRCYIHGNPLQDRLRIGVYIAARHVTVRDSEISDCQDSGSEGKAIVILSAGGPTYIINNRTSASMIQLLTGGDDEPVPGLLNSDVHVVGNAFIRDMKYWNKSGALDPTWPCYDGQYWKNAATAQAYECRGGTWQPTAETRTNFGAKNGLDFKNTNRVVVKGNIVRNVWGGSLNQRGAALLFNQVDSYAPSGWMNPWAVNQDFVVEANRFENTTDGITFGRVGAYWRPMRRLQIRNNLVVNMADEKLSANSEGKNDANFWSVMTTTLANVAIYHNTWTKSPGAGPAFNWVFGASGANDLDNIRFTDNIAAYFGGPTGAGGFDSLTAGPGWCSLLDMGYRIPKVDFHNVTFTNEFGLPLQFTAGPGNCGLMHDYPLDFNGVESQAAVFRDPGAGDYGVKAGSPAAGTALSGADRGADTEMVAWATQMTEEGRPNPYHEFVLRQVTATADGAVVDVLAPGVSDACSVTAGTTRMFAPPRGSATEERAGRRRVFTVRGLNRGTHYYLKAECGGYRKEGEFTTSP